MERAVDLRQRVEHGLLGPVARSEESNQQGDEQHGKGDGEDGKDAAAERFARTRLVNTVLTDDGPAGDEDWFGGGEIVGSHAVTRSLNAARVSELTVWGLYVWDRAKCVLVY